MRVVTGIPLDDWRKAAVAARAAEAMGFDGVMSAEIAHDPFIPLAMAAMATERIELATGIAVAFPRSPMITANLAWDLQAHSGGRFALGLGAQVKGHNERRFSVPWSSPVPRLREYVEALRAIWRAWEKREKLAYEGRHYRFTLMTPEFSPRPTGLPPVPVTVAAVGPDMLRMAGRSFDGVRLHGFCTRRYMEEVALPKVEEGLEGGARTRTEFEVSGGGFIATGPDAAAVAKAVEETRYRISFYGSTRTYQGVLSLHGLDDLAAELHRMSVEGKWQQMASRVSDDVVRLFTAVATYDELPREVEKRFGGIADVIGIGFMERTPDGLKRELVQDLKRIPSPFRGFRKTWD
jgi:probable F420-dependent oxidoreductase